MRLRHAAGLFRSESCSFRDIALQNRHPPNSFNQGPLTSQNGCKLTRTHRTTTGRKPKPSLQAGVRTAGPVRTIDLVGRNRQLIREDFALDLTRPAC